MGFSRQEYRNLSLLQINSRKNGEFHGGNGKVIFYVASKIFILLLFMFRSLMPMELFQLGVNFVSELFVEKFLLPTNLSVELP